MATAGQKHSSCNCPVFPDRPSRNLVICIDGTSQRPSIRNTNILELCCQLVKSDEQLIFYNTGVGVCPNIPGHRSFLHSASKNVGAAFGWHLERGIMQAYSWICNNYRDGDKLFFFGFSRGAYQVRALAGMVERVGLLPPHLDHLVELAFEAYSNSDDAGSHHLQAVDVFKTEFLRTARVHFVGVWDTVSSINVHRGKMLPLVTSCDHICYFRHALALDERRVKFLPEYVYGGRTDFANDDHVKEVWFPGSHSDVGGGNRLNPKLQSGEIPLLWMRAEASLKGLLLKPSVVMWKIEDLNKPITPLDWWWWPLEFFPFRRLCYNNTSKTTLRPHMGAPRQILRGQKVHVSALLKSSYKPSARFHHGFETWPVAMLWNNPRNHDCLQQLSSTWEMDIFDSCSVQSLLAALQLRKTNLDALDRLAFMAGFDSGRSVIAGTENAKQTLASLLEDGNDSVRISAAVTYCEVGWKWPLQSEHHEKSREMERVVQDINTLLTSEDPRRACMSLPSLCKNTYLKTRLLSEPNLRRLLTLIATVATVRTGISYNKSEDEGDSFSSIAFHSAQALAALLEMDEGLCLRITEMGGVSDLIPTLYDHHDTVLVAVMRTLTGLAQCGDARKIMCTAAIVPTLLGLARRLDDFVTPPAIDLLCLLFDEAPMHILVNSALPLFVDMTGKASDAVRQTGAKALAEFAKYDEQGLIKGGYVNKLAKQAINCGAVHQDGAIRSLLALPPQVQTTVLDALTKAKTVESLISQLRKKSHCLAAVSALASLMAIDHVAKTVIGSEAPVYICNMLKRRWFDGHDGEDGVSTLQRVLGIDALRAVLLKNGAVDSLLAMLKEKDGNVVYAGLQYLREVIRYDDGKRAISIQNMVSPLLKALQYPRPLLQRSAVAVLRVLFNEETLHPDVFDGLLSMLNSREAGSLYGAATALRILCSNEAAQSQVVMDTDNNFWKLSHDYYNRLEVRYDEKGPSFREVYQSVGDLIATVQEGISNNHTSDNQWLESAPYELQREHNPIGYCAKALGTSIHSPLSLFKSLCQRAAGLS